MTLNESIVEDAALTWFSLCPVRQAQGYGGQVGDQGYAVGHRPLQSRTHATLRDTLLPQLLSWAIHLKAAK